MREGQSFCAVVKANAYGLGAKKICGEINDLVDYFAVSSEDEFFDINDVSKKPILLLDPIYKNITKLARFNCEFCISNKTQLELFLKEADENKDVAYKLHVAFNSGMNRFGFNTEEEVWECIDLIKKTQNISIIGVFSHFYAGNNRDFAKTQLDKLSKLKTFLVKKTDNYHLMFHISNTAGFANERGFDMCRIGLGMFLNDNNSVFSLESKIIEIQHLKPGETVGYGGGFFVTKKTDVAVVAIGYADGVFRKIVGKGFVIVNGCLCQILAVCMDSIIIDITSVKAKLQDTVTLIGKNGGREIFVCDFANWCDTIEYEIMTRFSKRVKRVYIGGQNANHNRKV